MFKNYNNNQLIMLLDLEFSSQENEITYAVNDLVEGIPNG